MKAIVCRMGVVLRVANGLVCEIVLRQAPNQTGRTGSADPDFSVLRTIAKLKFVELQGLGVGVEGICSELHDWLSRESSEIESVLVSGDNGFWAGVADGGLRFVRGVRQPFFATHEQSQLPVSYGCHRLHGHGYVLEMGFSSSHLTDKGAVLDLAQMALARKVAGDLDGRFLNDVLPGYTSSECVTRWVWDWLADAGLPGVDQVAVWETPKIRASVSRDGIFSISKDFHFSASSGFVADNLVARLVMESSELDGYGFVFDLERMKAFKAVVDENYDHRDLSERIPGLLTQGVARLLFEAAVHEWSDKVKAVRVLESTGDWLEYGFEKAGS